MKIFDLHCDVLSKMLNNPSIDFIHSNDLQVDYQGLLQANVKVQCFAVFVSPKFHEDHAFNAALYMIDLFFEKILKTSSRLKLVRTKRDIENLGTNEIGAMLSLEGCDSIGRDLIKLRTLLRLGVTSVGLTWNHANHAGDGAMEARGCGLSQFGKEVVALLNETDTWCDVSHLSEKGFWDVMETANFPFASHSNCYSLCAHPRNLNDEQITALIQRNSAVGITFVPEFLKEGKVACISDVIRHVEHICELGGENHIGFGSDFDGVEVNVKGLESVYKYPKLINELLKYYTEKQVVKFLFDNMMKRYPGQGTL